MIQGIEIDQNAARPPPAVEPILAAGLQGGVFGAVEGAVLVQIVHGEGRYR